MLNKKPVCLLKTDRKTERLFSLVLKTKVVQNVNRQKDKATDKKRELHRDRQNDIMAERLYDSAVQQTIELYYD